MIVASSHTPAANTGLAAALIGVGGLILVAVLTAVFMWLLNRRVGRPNGSGTLTQMGESTLIQLGEIKQVAGEALTARRTALGMAEDSALGLTKVTRRVTAL